MIPNCRGRDPTHRRRRCSPNWPMARHSRSRGAWTDSADPRQCRNACLRRRCRDRRDGRRHRPREAHVHVCAYIWLADHNGCKVKDALIRAAKRGTDVRVLADALGSRRFIRSKHWRELSECGVRSAGRASGRQSSDDGNPGAGRPAQSSQVHDRRQSHCLVREPELGRSRIPHQTAVRPLGGHHEPVGRPGRGPMPVSVRVRLDGRRRRRHQCSPVRAATTGARQHHRPGVGHRTDHPLRRDAVLLCRADPLGAPSARRHDALFRSRRAGAVRFDLGGYARSRRRSSSCPGATTA